MTMTPSEAMTRLLAKVEAGEYNAAVGLAENIWGARPINWINFSAAYRGSLDATKALHDDLVPDQSTRIERRVGGWVVWLDSPHRGIHDNLARAWLIAILKSLITQEGE